MAGDSKLVLDLHDVAKTYKGKVRALCGVDLRVHGGEVFGLLGPNGAGKSTLVKILMTVIRPTRCQGTLLGEPVGHKPTLARVGYLPEHHKFPGYLTGAQVLDFYGAMAGVGRALRRRRTTELLELVGMRDWANKRVGGYSKGMRQRVGVAQALVNDPDLVLLDEPTDGVDPVGRKDIRDIVVRMKERGKAVFINSHLLSELEQVCDRVAILVQGAVASQGTLDELTKDQQRYVIEIASTDAARAQQMLDDAGDGSLPDARLEGDRLTLSTIDASAVQPMIDALRARGVTIRAIRPFRPSLEDLFMLAVRDPETGKSLAPGAVRGRKGDRS